MNQAGTLHISADKSGTSAGGRGLGLSLLVIATAQLMFVLDDTVANIALPSIQRALIVTPGALLDSGACGCRASASLIGFNGPHLF